MNSLDYAIMALAMAGAIYGVSRGVLRMLTSAASLIAALYFASEYHVEAAALAQRELGLYSTIATAVGYGAVFAIVFAAVETAGSLLTRLVHTVRLNWADRLGGAVFGAGVAIVFAGIALIILTALLPPHAMLLRESKLAPQVQAYNDMLSNYLPAELRNAYIERRDELVQYWTQHQSAIESAAKSAASAR